MNDLLATLKKALEGSSAASKATVALVAGALALAVGVGGYVSSRPHYEVLLSGLDDHESAEVMKSLSEAGIAFRVSQPPGPFVVYVDEGDRSAALAAAYGAGALDKPLEGIVAGGNGVASVFLSAGEREQVTRKRLWQEMEGVLEEFEFVEDARVQTSGGDRSPFVDGGRVTGSVQLRVRDGLPLEPSQARTVAMVVSRGLGVDAADLVVSDQLGRTLHDGSEEDEDTGRRPSDVLEHKERFDRLTSAKANAVLAEILGPDRARVTVDSLWSFEQSTSESEKASRGAVVSESSESSSEPVLAGGSGGPGGAAGTSANLPQGGAPGEGDGSAPVSSTDQERKEYVPSYTRESRVRTAPELTRLSVALFLDESVAPERVEGLVEAVKASVGFDAAGRGDQFQRVVLPFAGVERGEDGTPTAAPEAAEEPAEGPSPLVELAIERAVEVAAALVFLVVLLRALKGARRGEARATEAAAGGGEDAEAGLDPELLAQAQVQELLTASPERVGEILSQWARETRAGAAR